MALYSVYRANGRKRERLSLNESSFFLYAVIMA